MQASKRYALLLGAPSIVGQSMAEDAGKVMIGHWDNLKTRTPSRSRPTDSSSSTVFFDKTNPFIIVTRGSNHYGAEDSTLRPQEPDGAVVQCQADYRVLRWHLEQRVGRASPLVALLPSTN